MHIRATGKWKRQKKNRFWDRVKKKKAGAPSRTKFHLPIDPLRSGQNREAGWNFFRPGTRFSLGSGWSQFQDSSFWYFFFLFCFTISVSCQCWSRYRSLRIRWKIRRTIRPRSTRDEVQIWLVLRNLSLIFFLAWKTLNLAEGLRPVPRSVGCPGPHIVWLQTDTNNGQRNKETIWENAVHEDWAISTFTIHSELSIQLCNILHNSNALFDLGLGWVSESGWISRAELGLRIP